ncbi:ThiF family adenylyltransferase [Luteimicrobium subarcticum]|nr:ThiF family adenylyltransferase [Luteimicrobium subarcticum]
MGTDRTAAPVAEGGGPRSAALGPSPDTLTRGTLAPAELARYARHLPLPGVGLDGQRRLRDARVLVVGAGGLGSPVVQYLAAAGVGTLGIVDDDVVDASNLQRQVLHRDADVGRRKVDSARDAVARTNPHVVVEAHPFRLDASNAVDLVSTYDVVVDGTDSFGARYLVSDAAEVAGRPVVWGAVHQFDGQVAVFSARPLGDLPGVTYRDVFPDPPPPGTVPDCATGGVLGVTCGTVGTAMATEVVKLVTGVGTPLLGRLAVHDALDGTWRYLTVRADPAREPVTAVAEPAPVACAVPARADQGAAGDTSAPAAPPTDVSARELADLLESGADVVVVDVREDWELAAEPFVHAHDPRVRHVPSGTLLGGGDAARRALADLPDDRPVAVLCKAGPRSARVAEVAREAGVDARNVVGGLVAWRTEVSV